MTQIQQTELFSVTKRLIRIMRDGNITYYPCMMWEGDKEQMRRFLEERPDVLRAFVKDDNRMSLDAISDYGDDEYIRSVTYELWTDEGKTVITLNPMDIVPQEPGIENIIAFNDKHYYLLPASGFMSADYFMYRAEIFYSRLFRNYDESNFRFSLIHSVGGEFVINGTGPLFYSDFVVRICFSVQNGAVFPKDYFRTDKDEYADVELCTSAAHGDALMNGPKKIVCREHSLREFLNSGEIFDISQA